MEVLTNLIVPIISQYIYQIITLYILTCTMLNVNYISIKPGKNRYYNFDLRLPQFIINLEKIMNNALRSYALIQSKDIIL